MTSRTTERFPLTEPTDQIHAKRIFDSPMPVIIVALAIVLAAIVAIRPLAVPPALAGDATGGFDRTRALHDLAIITTAPRVPGSPGYDAAQRYLVAELEALGLTPEVTDDLAVHASGNNANVGRARNIVVRIPGSDSTGAVLLGGHLDSVHTTGAASDCGGCAVTVVETARALLAGSQLRNDVILLIEDGEETTRAGSLYFDEQHPWAQDVRVAFNLEAMGSGGASLLYVTGPQNGWLIDEALQAMPSPVAYSFVNDLVWGTGTGGSDLDQFLMVAEVGLGLIYLENVPVYHTMNDSVASLDPATLQHQGATMVALARHFGNLPLAGTLQRDNLVYYNLFGHQVIRYPAWFGILLALLTAGAAITLIVVGLGRKQLTGRGILVGALVFLPLVLIATAIAGAFWYLLRLVDPRLQVFLIGVSYDREFYTLAFALLSAGIMVAGYRLLRRHRAADLGIGALLWWVLLALLTAFWLPGSSYAFALPALFALVMVAALLFMANRAAWLRMLLLALAAAGAVLIFAPVVNFLGIFSGRAEILMPLPMIAILPALFVGLFAGLLLPLVDEISMGRRGMTGSVLVALALLIVIGVALTADFTAARPKPNMVAYRLDADSGAAEWITGGANVAEQRRSLLDEWTTQFFAAGVEETSYSPWGAFMADSYPAYRSPAPPLDLPAPAVEVMADTIDDNNQRQLQLRLTSPRDAAVLVAHLSTTGQIVAAAIEGKPMDDVTAATPYSALKLSFYAVAGDGVALTLTLAEPASVTVAMEDHTYALPTIDELTIQPRPAWMMPSPTFVSDATLVRRTVTIP